MLSKRTPSKSKRNAGGARVHFLVPSNAWRQAAPTLAFFCGFGAACHAGHVFGTWFS